MDFGKHLSALNAPKTGLKSASSITVMIAPIPREVPGEALIVHRVCVSPSDVIAASEGDVLLFSEENERLLKMVVEYREVFGFQIVVLVGLPDADYAPWFDGVVWGVDQVSYSSVVSEMSVANDAIKKAAESGITRHERERAQVSRPDGSVRQNDNFTKAGELEGEEDDPESEDD